MVCLAPGPSRLPILPPLAPPLRHARIGILLLRTLQLLPPSSSLFLLLLLFPPLIFLPVFIFPISVEQCSTRATTKTSFSFSVLPANFSLFERKTRVDLCQAVLSCLLDIFNCLVVFSTLFYVRTAWLLAWILGDRVRKMNLSFMQFRSSSCVIINLLFASVSALYRKRYIASWGVCCFGDMVLHVYLCDFLIFFCPWLGILSSDNKWLFFFKFSHIMHSFRTPLSLFCFLLFYQLTGVHKKS